MAVQFGDLQIFNMYFNKAPLKLRIEKRGDPGEKASFVVLYQLAFLLKIYVVCFISTRKSGQK